MTITDLEPSYRAVDIYDSIALSEWMSAKLGRPWSVQQAGSYGEPCGQDTLLQFDVSPEGDDTGIDVVVDTEAWLQSEPAPSWGVGRWDDEKISTETLLCYLCAKGLIRPGLLLVRVWW